MKSINTPVYEVQAGGIALINKYKDEAVFWFSEEDLDAESEWTAEDNAVDLLGWYFPGENPEKFTLRYTPQLLGFSGVYTVHRNKEEK